MPFRNQYRGKGERADESNTEPTGSGGKAARQEPVENGDGNYSDGSGPTRLWGSLALPAHIFRIWQKRTALPEEMTYFTFSSFSTLPSRT